MIRTIRGLGKIVVVGVSVLGPGGSALAQSPPGGMRGLPEAPPLVAPPPGPNIGTSPGALAPSEFSPQGTAIIGGKARGGTGRIPRKLTRAGQATPSTAPGIAGLALPSALTDTSGPDTSDSTSPGAIVDDEGDRVGLSLDEAIDRMIAANLDLLALKYEIPQADADILTAGLRANPLIYTDAQLIPYGPYRSSRPVGPTEYDISITHPLDLSHKRRSRLLVARAAKSTIEAQFQDAARRQVGNLYRAFVDLQAARVDVLTGEAALRSQDRTLAQARRLKSTPEDLAKLESQIEKARDSLNDARDSLDDARESLGLLLNLPPEEVSKIHPRGTLRDLVPPPPPLEELTRLALETRPDLIAARRGIGRAESEVKLARSNRFNDVFLFYDPYSYQDNRISQQPSGRSWALGLTVPLPIYDRNQGNIAKAGSNLTQTQIEMAALERRIVSEVRLADREYRSSRQAFERAEKTTRPRALQDRAKAAAEFAAGKIGLGDYLDRLDDNNDAARAYRDALIRHRRGMLDLNTALGFRLLP